MRFPSLRHDEHHVFFNVNEPIFERGLDSQTVRTYGRYLVTAILFERFPDEFEKKIIVF